jgi:hypothetical protein
MLSASHGCDTKNSKVGSLLPFAALAQTVPKTTVFGGVMAVHLADKVDS